MRTGGAADDFSLSRQRRPQKGRRAPRARIEVESWDGVDRTLFERLARDAAGDRPRARRAAVCDFSRLHAARAGAGEAQVAAELAGVYGMGAAQDRIASATSCLQTIGGQIRPDPMSDDSRIDALYQLPLDQFTPARNALAKELKRPDHQGARKAEPRGVGGEPVVLAGPRLYDRLMQRLASVCAPSIASSSRARSSDIRETEKAHREAIRDAVDKIRGAAGRRQGKRCRPQRSPPCRRRSRRCRRANGQAG